MTLLESHSILGRLKKVEEGLTELRTSKLSPFVQAEILERLDALEMQMKKQDESVTDALESLRLDIKFNQIKAAVQPMPETLTETVFIS